MRLLSSALLLLLPACMPVLETPGADDSGGGDTKDCEGWVAPENSWEVHEPPCLQAEGFQTGQVIPDMRLVDQFGDTVSAWQFYGNVIVLDLSTMWCAPCAALAKGVTETTELFEDEGFTYITMLSQDHLSQTPDQADLGEWEEENGMEGSPVLSDEAQQGYTSQIIPPGGSFPRVMLIGRDMRVLNESITPAEDPSVRSAVESAL